MTSNLAPLILKEKFSKIEVYRKGDNVSGLFKDWEAFVSRFYLHPVFLSFFLSKTLSNTFLLQALNCNFFSHNFFSLAKLKVAFFAGSDRMFLNKTWESSYFFFFL